MTVQEFCQLLTRSRLHPADVVPQLCHRWQAGARDRNSAQEFADWLVAQQLLTNHQATLLLTGHTDGYFIDQYRILERVAKGRMAGVFRAVHPLGQQVALKVLPPSRAKDPDTLTRFQREAKLAAQLNHANVVRTFHFGESNGVHFLAMEYLDGMTLGDLLKERSKVPPKEAVRIAFLAALGLQHLHEKGVVHRDLNPSNLMLIPSPGQGENTLRCRVKIMDIGLGRALFDDTPTGAPLTSEGEILGTPEYLSPEQARDARRADIRSDLYSLGCALFHALTGETPFVDSNPVRQMLKHATEPLRPLREFSPEAPADLQRILDKLLAKDPLQRYQSPKQAADALRNYLAVEGEPAHLKAATTEEKSYEEWVTKAMAAPPTGAPVTAKPAAPARRVAEQEVVAIAAAPAAPAERAEKRRRPKHRPAPAPSEDVPVARSALIEIDVEPINEAELNPPAPFGFGIPRDVFMILVGGLTVLFLVSVIWLIAVMVAGDAGTPPPAE
jgi:serine/threonine protein kinase